MNQGFNQIKFQTENAINTFDLTNAVQVSFDVRAFNRKLGIFKGDNNITLLDPSLNFGEGAGVYYDTVNDRFVNTASGSPVAFDSITLTADQFRTGLTNASQVLSVGYYNTLYSDFISYVKSYFGYAGGFSTLFQNAETFNYNNGLFDGSALINLINASGIPMSDPSAAFIQNVSGSITIPNVTEVLRFAVDSNCFNNRTPAVTSAAGSNTSTDPTDHSNYGVQDGFIAGDLIWVPTGTTVTLGVGIDSEAVSSALNNIGPAATSALISQLNSSVALNYTQSGAPFSSQTSATLTKISRTLTAPLVIRLDNLSSTAYLNPIYAGLFGGETYYYKFDGSLLNTGSGTGAISMVGNVTFSSTIKKVGAYSVQTSPGNNYLILPPMTFSPAGFSLATWYYSTGSASRVFEFNYNQYGGGNATIQLYGGSGTTTYPLTYQDFVAAANRAILYNGSANNFSVNTWYHIAMTLAPGSSNNVNFYINGVLTSTFSINYDGASNSTVNNGSSSTRNLNYLGYSGQSQASFTAYYDDFRIYNGMALTPAQITTIYNYAG